MPRQKQSMDNFRAVGQAIRAIRVSKGMTQKELANAIGLAQTGTITQVENGNCPLPVYLWAPMAKALGLDRAKWSVFLLGYTNPTLYQALFGHAGNDVVTKALQGINQGATE